MASDSAIILASISKGAPIFIFNFFKGTTERMGFMLTALLIGASTLKFFLKLKGVTAAWNIHNSLK